jgi:hypothetical protein
LNFPTRKRVANNGTSLKTDLSSPTEGERSNFELKDFHKMLEVIEVVKPYAET